MDTHSFSLIDARREKLGIKQNELCRAADVNEGTYSRARRTSSEPTPRVRRKLWTALEAIREERGLILEHDIEEVRHAAE
jgi:transcriptional regulator with XRE-family HTH domain